MTAPVCPITGEPYSPETVKALRKHEQMIGLVCGNLLAGRPGLSGMGQFLDQDVRP